MFQSVINAWSYSDLFKQKLVICRPPKTEQTVQEAECSGLEDVQIALFYFLLHNFSSLILDWRCVVIILFFLQL